MNWWQPKASLCILYSKETSEKKMGNFTLSRHLKQVDTAFAHETVLACCILSYAGTIVRIPVSVPASMDVTGVWCCTFWSSEYFYRERVVIASKRGV